MNYSKKYTNELVQSFSVGDLLKDYNSTSHSFNRYTDGADNKYSYNTSNMYKDYAGTFQSRRQAASLEAKRFADSVESHRKSNLDNYKSFSNSFERNYPSSFKNYSSSQNYLKNRGDDTFNYASLMSFVKYRHNAHNNLCAQ